MKVGDKLSNFLLKDRNGVMHSLRDITSDYIILYFYPKDNTPGCTIEANKFNEDIKKFRKMNAEIIGISGGNEKTKDKFCNANNLKILLLSDTDFKISTKYGLYGEKSFMGRKYMGISRVTFILDKNKKIIKIYDKVKPLTHSKEVLKFIEDL